tara:strand:+ start:875 stop:1765 length:891 start_codon:yes stop_codon:yes gene_type:complete
MVFVNNRVIDFLSSPLLSIVVPSLLGLYYGSLDIWGDDWGIIADYKAIHEVAFAVFSGLTVIILFMKGISEQVKGNVQKKYQKILESLLEFFNELVKKKRDRFYKSAKNVKPRGDIFKTITQPRDQLEFVLDGTKRLLSQGFNIEPKNIGITIIQGQPSESRWWYEFKCDSQKQHTKAKTLMDGKSTARYCFEQGESIFIPDLRKGEKEEVFLQSNRSKKSELGSIYCKPVRITVGGVEYHYIFTMCVYSQLICTPYDVEECKACEQLFDEVADRVELELYLHSLKTFKELGGVAA